MDNSIEWEPEFFEAIVSLTTVIICLVGYWFTIRSSYLHKLFNRKFGEERGTIRWIFFQRYAGVFFFLLIPLTVIYTVFSQDLTRYGIGTVNLRESILWILALGVLIVFFQALFARNPGNLVHYPQIRVPVWNFSLIVMNSMTWFFYLVSYEFMFRGFLLFETKDAMGIWPAILVNTVIYSLAHLPKGARETILAIPFGILICYLTLRTGTIWVAVFLHYILAVSNDIFSIIAHPDMKFKR